MHGTLRPAEEAKFIKLEKRLHARQMREFLYIRILATVERMIGEEALITYCTISKRIGLDDVRIGRLINQHPPLMRIISRHQRKHGWTLAQRMKMAAEVTAH